MLRIVILFLIVNITNFAQVQMNGNLQTYIDNIISNMPDSVGGNDYLHPTVNEQNSWAEIVDSILAGNYSAAHTLASSIDYRIVEYTDNSVSPNVTYYLLQMDQNGSKYWGTYIFNPDPVRAQLVIQSPHPKKDYNTGKQGFFVFREVGARAFFLSGTSRCSSSTYSICDGTTSVCSDASEAYRISDQAHTLDGTFQITTEQMLNNNSNLIFIQLHGFTKLSSDPYVIMSNGVQDDTPPIDYLSTLKSNLYKEDTTLTFKIAHIDTTWDRLLGTTNTQGRLINGSSNPCDDKATVNTGQFLHLEQEKTKLRDNQTGWAKMANAIAATFPEVALPVELTLFTGQLTDNSVLLNWETATEVNNYGFEIERKYQISSIEYQDWEKIGFVLGHGTSNSTKEYSFTDDLNPNLTQVSYRIKQIDLDGTFAYSKTITIDLTDITSADEEKKYDFFLEQNYPNPFNPTTTISFSLNQPEFVTIKLFNSIGELVETLVADNLPAGRHEYKFNGSILSSGIYIYKLILNNKIEQSRKMVLLR